MSKPEHSFITERTVIRSHGVDPSTGPNTWYVLRHRTDPRAIALMLADMAAEGFEAYMPQLLVKRRVMRNRVLSSRKEWLSEPLFHGYLFARPNGKPARLGKSLTQVYAIEGCRPVGRVAQADIDRIRAAESEVLVTEGGSMLTLRGLVEAKADRPAEAVDEWRAGLAPGERVEVDAFGFGRFISGVVSANRDGRLTLLTEFVSRFTVEPRHVVRPVEGGHMDTRLKGGG